MAGSTASPSSSCSSCSSRVVCSAGRRHSPSLCNRARTTRWHGRPKGCAPSRHICVAGLMSSRTPRPQKRTTLRKNRTAAVQDAAAVLRALAPLHPTTLDQTVDEGGDGGPRDVEPFGQRRGRPLPLGKEGKQPELRQRHRRVAQPGLEPTRQASDHPHVLVGHPYGDATGPFIRLHEWLVNRIVRPPPTLREVTWVTRRGISTRRRPSPTHRSRRR